MKYHKDQITNQQLWDKLERLEKMIKFLAERMDIKKDDLQEFDRRKAKGDADGDALIRRTYEYMRQNTKRKV